MYRYIIIYISFSVSQTRRCAVLNQSNVNEENSLQYSVDTGDLGEIKNGDIYYRGRRDNVVKRFGNKINLQSIEYVVMQNPHVKACSCIWLPKPMLLIVYFTSETISSNTLGDFLKNKLDDKMWPDKIIKIDNMPITLHGKISKEHLHELHENCIQNNSLTTDLKVILLNELVWALNKNFTYEEIKDKDFFSLGGTSFLAITLCNKLSHEHGEIGKLMLQFLLSNKNTIDKIIKMVERELKKPGMRNKVLKRNSSNVEGVVLRKKYTHLNSIQEMKTAFNISVHWTYNTGKCVDASPSIFEYKK